MHTTNPGARHRIIRSVLRDGTRSEEPAAVVGLQEIASREPEMKLSHSMIEDLLHDLRYSLQSNRRTRGGPSHPDQRPGQMPVAQVCFLQLSSPG
jgi:hypothetical protein